MEPNKVSKPDFQQAEQNLLHEHRQNVEKRIGRSALKALLHGGFHTDGVENRSLEDNNYQEDYTPEDDFSLADFYDEFEYQDLLEDIPKEIDVAKSTKELAAENAMREAIRTSFIDGAKEYFDINKAISKQEFMFKFATHQAVKASPNSPSNRTEFTDKILDTIDDLNHQKEQLTYSSPEAYTVVRGYELRKYKEELDSGGIVSTPYAEKNLNEVKKCIEKGQPVLIHGHLGGGKTELAMRAAREYSMSEAAYQQSFIDIKDYQKNNPDATGAERRTELARFYRKNLNQLEKSYRDGDSEAIERFSPIFISGSKDLTNQDLYTDKTLKLTKFNGKPLLEHKEDLDNMVQEWEDAHMDELDAMSEPERQQMRRDHANEILELYKMKNQAFGTEVETIKQGILRGVEEGRPVIIDEVNAIPTAILISMNDILTKRPGKTANVPGVGPVRIKKGFDIIMTGNISSGTIDYSGTNKLNPAFESRLKPINYDYLPMSNTDRDYTEQYNPAQNELFQVLTAYMLDRQGNLTMPEPERNLSKIFALSQLAHETQQVFAGKWDESSANIKSNSGDEIAPRLEGSVLSIRNAINILKEWNNGQDKDFDKALWDGFISGITDADEQNYILALAKMHNFFPAEDGWQIDIKPMGSSFTTLSEIHPGKFNHIRKNLETMPVNEVVEAVFGPGPQREIYPEDINLDELEDMADSEPTIEDITEAEAKLDEIIKAIDALKVLYEQCGCDISSQSSEKSGE